MSSPVSRWAPSFLASGAVFSRWIGQRLALPVLIALAGAILFVSEETYRETTSTLRDGIALTDARLQSARLLQLTTDAENAQFGFLATGNPQYIAQFEAARSEVPAVDAAIMAYFGNSEPNNPDSAQQLISLSRQRFDSMAQVLQRARDEKVGAATNSAPGAAGNEETASLKKAFAERFARSAARQSTARLSIYEALLVQRVAVGSLTVITLLSLFLFFRQLRSQARSVQEQKTALLREREHLEVQVKRRTRRLSELAKHLQSVSEIERATLARELHDELGGILTVSKLEIARARTKVGEPEELLRRLDRISSVLNEGISLKRRIIEDLRPSALTHLGLTVALQNLCAEMSDSIGVPVRLSLEEVRLPPEADLAVYRFVQEALTNIAKYAGARNVDVTLRTLKDKAVVSVRDDGIGFDLKASRAGQHGLTGMQFRAESLGGSMYVVSAPGQGCTVSIEFTETLKPPSEAPFNSGWQSLGKTERAEGSGSSR